MTKTLICKIQSLSFSYGKQEVLKDINLEIEKGKCLVILGASGSGKSTLGQILAGLITPVHPNTISWIDSIDQKNTLLKKRHTQLVFQDPGAALTPFYTPFKTIFEVLKLHCSDTQATLEKKTVETLLQFGLNEDIFHKKIKFLSGGQKQRLNLARAFCLKPELLILDEPLSSCDVFLQKEILDLLKKTIKESSLSCVIILHDLYQAAYIADTICLLHKGVIEAIGSKDTFLKTPPTPYAQKFLASF